MRGPDSTGDWVANPTYPLWGWAVAVTVLTGLATLFLGAANALVPMIARSMVDDPGQLKAAHTAVLLETASAPNTLWVLVALMVWMWRAMKNTAAFPMPEGGLKAHWAIWGWLIPVVCVYTPPRMMQQLVREEREGSGWSNIARLWWLSFCVAVAVNLAEMVGFFGRPPAASAPSEEHLAFFDTRIISGVTTAICLLIAGVTLIALVLGISSEQTRRIDARAARQRAAFAAMAAGHPAPAAPAQPALATL